MRSATAGERIARFYASAVVGLRVPIVLAWIAVTVLAVVFLPQLGGSGSAPISDIVPSNAKSLNAEDRALRLFGSSVATDVVVVQRNPRGLASREIDATVTRARDTMQDPQRRIPGVRAAIPLVNAPAPGVRWGERSTTALTYLFMDPSLNLIERDQTARRYAASLGPPQPGSTRRITGAGPARLQQFDEIDRALPWVTVATILMILLIVSLYFRSVGAPLVTLATAGLGYVIAVRVLAWASERAGVTAPSEIEPVLVVLLLGLVTDYTVFFMSETRRRLLRGERRVQAAKRAATRIAPIVLTAGVLVAAGAVSLLAGKMEFFRVFGPGLAVCALVVTVICVTLVPALMGLLGPWLFGKRVREAQAPSRTPAGAVVAAVSPDTDEAARREKWRLRFAGPLGALRASRRHARTEGGWVTPRFITRLLTARPIAAVVALVVIAVLVITAAGARNTHLAVSFIPSLPRHAEARQAGVDAARGFVPGILSPTDVVVEQGGIARRTPALIALQRELQHTPGVAVVLGPSQSPGPPLQRFVVARGGGAVRYAVLLDDEPTGADAIATITRLEDRMPGMLRRAGLPPNARVSFAGESALAKETVDAMVSDLRRVAVAMALLTVLLLAIFLRSLIAPLLLLGSVLAFAASFGLTALLLPRTVGGTDFIYYVPLVAAVLLVGLGSDYNVFIAGRIREEAQRRRIREAVAIGAPSASKAITVAGITLAATFALLALVPLRPFRELALLMSIGVLIDALLVRPLLIPTLIAAVGRFSWWPGTPQRPAEARAFLQEVAARTGDDVDDARSATRATLCTLSERIPEREAHELARHLPEEFLPELNGRGDGEGEARHGEIFGLDEFVDRVADRTGTSPSAAWDDARAVISTVREAVPEEELEYVRAALSEDYRPLFGDALAPVPPVGGDGDGDRDRLGPRQPPSSSGPSAPPPATVG